MSRVHESGIWRVLRLFVGLVVMLLAVSAGRFFGIEQANTLADKAIAVAT